ncbi:MAG TPA: hypothetical protein VM287_12355, partial [Egibacteraceae bacterium]|nr:hypothetical protein [Egibacteraceae bacterium]
MMRLRVAALSLGALLLAAAPVGAQDLPDPGGLLPGGDPGAQPDGTAPDAGTTATLPAAGPVFAGVANAIGLELQLAGQGLTIGFTDARVQSGPTEDGCEGDRVACALAAGELLLGETAEAFAPGNEGPNDATALALPLELEDLLDLDVGVAVAQASITPSAEADAAAATLALNVTRTLADQLAVQEPLQEISDSLLGGIVEDEPTGDLVTRLKETLDFVIQNLDEVPLATLEVGPSSSESSSTAGVTRALASAQGAKLVLVPTPAQELLDVGIEGLVIVEVGAASAEVSTDSVTGQATADPAIARVSVLDPGTLSYDVVELVPGAAECVADGTPLRICISLAGSEIVQDGPNAAAAAQAVQIRALADPLPEVLLSLAAVLGWAVLVEESLR